MTFPLVPGGRVMSSLITDLQTSHRQVLLALKEVLDHAAHDDCKGVLTKLAELFPELDSQKTMLFELQNICRDSAKRGPYQK